jgi:hypothetical protein
VDTSRKGFVAKVAVEKIDAGARAALAQSGRIRWNTGVPVNGSG